MKYRIKVVNNKKFYPQMKEGFFSKWLYFNDGLNGKLMCKTLEETKNIIKEQDSIKIEYIRIGCISEVLNKFERWNTKKMKYRIVKIDDYYYPEIKGLFCWNSIESDKITYIDKYRDYYEKYKFTTKELAEEFIQSLIMKDKKETYEIISIYDDNGNEIT